MSAEDTEHGKPPLWQASMEVLAIRKQTAREAMHNTALDSEERARAAAEFTHCQFELEQLAKRQITAVETNSRPLLDAMEALSLRKKAAALLLQEKGSSLGVLEKHAAEKEIAYCQSELEQLAMRQIYTLQPDAAKTNLSATRKESWVDTHAASDWQLRDAMEALSIRKQASRAVMTNTGLREEDRKQAAEEFSHCQIELEQLALQQIRAVESNTRPLMDAMEALSRRKRAAVALLQDAGQTPIDRSAAEKELAFCQSELESLATQQMQFLKINTSSYTEQPFRPSGLFPRVLSPVPIAPYKGFGCIPFEDISEILSPPSALYLSSRPPLICEAWLTSSKHIGAILDVTNAHSCDAGTACVSPWQPGIRYMNIPVFDTSETDLTCYFTSAVDFIHRARGDGLNVLVHCEQGISRSVSCVLAYLVVHLRRPLLDSYRLVEACRPIACPNPAFCMQLMSLEPASEECLLAVILLERGCADLKRQGVTAAMLTKAILHHQPDWWAAVSELRSQQANKAAGSSPSKVKINRSKSILPKISIPALLNKSV